MKLAEPFTKVTPLSKFITLILFVSLPFAGFYLGFKYNQLTNVDSAEKMPNCPTKYIVHPTVVPTPVVTQGVSSFSQNLINFNGISLTFPSSWEVTEKETVNSRKDYFIIKTDYQPYTVFVGLNVEINPPYKSSFIYEPARFMVGDIKIVDNGCGGAIRCDVAVVDGDVYLLDWIIEKSTQPVPANLDGIWQPDNNITREKLDDILKTIKKI